MPVLNTCKDATWNAADAAEFNNSIKRIRDLVCLPNAHFTHNELTVLRAMMKKLNQIADEFEEGIEHSPLIGYEVNGLSGLRASMGMNANSAVVNRHRLWDGTTYLSELDSDTEVERMETDFGIE